MTWWNPKTWFKKAPAEVLGVFVEVALEYGFGRIVPAEAEHPPFVPCLHIPDISLEEAEERLAGKQFDWQRIPAPYRAFLSLGAQVHEEPWSEVQQFLKDV